MEEITKRLKEAFEYIRSKGVVHTQKDVALMMQVNDVSVSRAFNGYKKYLTESFVEKFCAIYPVFDKDWIWEGKGEMLKNQVPKEIEIGGGTVDSAFRKTNGSLYNLVPVYNFDAVGGLSASNDITDSPAYIERHIPFVGARKDDFCVHVTGSSMMPTHCPGSILLVREVQNWREYFGYGHCYVIFLNDGRRILKEVRKFTENPKEYVLCVSHNKEYPDEELPKGMITAVYKVIMTLTNEGF